MKKTVALIFGGEGAERRVSELSAASVLKSIDPETKILKIGISENGSWFLFEGDDSEIESGAWKTDSRLTPVYPARLDGESGFIRADGVLIKADIAFPVLHGDKGEDGTVQGALSCAHIPYIGSDTLSSALTSDKAYTKIIAEYLSIPTLPWFIPSYSGKNDIRREAERRLGYPFFIKPRRLGSSIGASPVFSKKDFGRAYELAVSSCGEAIMIESLADVKAELEFALFDGKKRFISREGVIHSSGRFYDYSAKYEGTGTPKIEAGKGIDKATVRKARAMSKKLSDFLGLGNISRIDFFLTPSGELFFNEINSIPGLTKDSLYPRLAELSGNFASSFADELIDSHTV